MWIDLHVHQSLMVLKSQSLHYLKLPRTEKDHLVMWALGLHNDIVTHPLSQFSFKHKKLGIGSRTFNKSFLYHVAGT